MNNFFNKRATAFITLALTTLLLAIWVNLKDIISNEQLINYHDARNPRTSGVKLEILKNYPKVTPKNIYYPNQSVVFPFECNGISPDSIADRWILHLTGTAFENNFGYLTITIDDSTSKKFRTFAFKDYRYKYVIHFDKHSQTLPNKVHVEFKFSGNNSTPIFEMPLINLFPEIAEDTPLPPKTLLPTSFKRYHNSGTCKLGKPELSQTG